MSEVLKTFIAEHGIKLAVQLLSKPPADMSAEDRKSDPNRGYWLVTLSSKHGTPFTCNYSMGSAYRVWKKSATTLIPAEMAQRAKGEMARPVGGVQSIHFIENTEPAPPEVADVLECLVSDAQSHSNAIEFEDWASDYGYDSDSRKAEKVYKACGEIAANLKRLVGQMAYAELIQYSGNE